MIARSAIDNRPDFLTTSNHILQRQRFHAHLVSEGGSEAMMFKWSYVFLYITLVEKIEILDKHLYFHDLFETI